MIDIRKGIHSQLKSIHPRVYFQRAPDTAQWPYITYNMPTVLDQGEGFQLFTFEVDGWDMPETGDTMALELLMQKVNGAINKKVVTNIMEHAVGGFLSPSMYIYVDNTESGGFACVLHLDRRLNLDDEDPRIVRRKYVYQGRLIERGDYGWL